MQEDIPDLMAVKSDVNYVAARAHVSDFLRQLPPNLVYDNGDPHNLLLFTGCEPEHIQPGLFLGVESTRTGLVGIGLRQYITCPPDEPRLLSPPEHASGSPIITQFLHQQSDYLLQHVTTDEHRALLRAAFAKRSLTLNRRYRAAIHYDRRGEEGESMMELQRAMNELDDAYPQALQAVRTFRRRSV